ncbi:MAG: helix-turn-helix domain-containing protein [Saprospiraceae bacterium]|nr:helix-turn-helix domain-containing protein [Saprospiraceae bacterium]MBP7699524.1 helix-turn-helix domain-containing protein [Saprospiraceae bacterium]
MNDKQIKKIIFGLRLRQLRQQQELSFASLSERTGIATSYLNEIEKGKKFPKEDKVILLAKALNVSLDVLLTTELEPHFTPVKDLIKSDFLNELPLDIFGIDQSKVIDIISNAPKKVGAFISTLLEAARSFAFREEHFYLRAMRAYQEMHYNYFEDIETETDKFIQHFQLMGIASTAQLETILTQHFRCQIRNEALKQYPELHRLKSVFVANKRQLLLNKLNETQRRFQIAKELGFQYLQLAERPNTSTLLQVNSFEVALNNFKAAYFAVSLLVPRQLFLEDLAHFFSMPKWDAACLQQFLEKYNVSPETLFQRFNLAAHYFGLQQFFFIRVVHHLETDFFEIDKELHLARRHRPHGNELQEHYCRRWVAVSALRTIQRENKEVDVAVQRSKYMDSPDEYICFTIARRGYASSDNRNVSVTIGLLINEDAYEKIAFLKDKNIPQREVNITCERCGIANCAERAAPATVLKQRQRRQQLLETLKKL